MPPHRPAAELQQVFSDKAEARSAVWKALVAHKAARFPFPLKGRIPNFEGADRAAALLLGHPVFTSAKCVKVNPDSPQRYVRKGLLDRGIVIVTPTPRLHGGFYRLDPARVPRQHYWDAASMKMGGYWGEAIALDNCLGSTRSSWAALRSRATARGWAKVMATRISSTPSCASSVSPPCPSPPQCTRCR